MFLKLALLRENGRGSTFKITACANTGYSEKEWKEKQGSENHVYSSGRYGGNYFWSVLFIYFNGLPVCLQLKERRLLDTMSHELPSPPSERRRIQVNYHSIQNRARLLRLGKTLICPGGARRASNTAATGASASNGRFIAPLIHVSFAIP